MRSCKEILHEKKRLKVKSRGSKKRDLIRIGEQWLEFGFCETMGANSAFCKMWMGASLMPETVMRFLIMRRD